MPTHFDHEKLNVYREAIRFVAWADEVLRSAPRRPSVCDQLDRAATSMPLNIAEGNGKFTAPDRCRYLDNARGSALECASCLDVMLAKELIGVPAADAGKEILVGIVSMLVGLIKRTSPERVFEERVEYKAKSKITSTSKSMIEGEG